MQKHADALLPARPLVMWHYTDLSDSRYAIGPKFIGLATNEKMPEPQEFGVLSKTGWAAYARKGLLFVKRMKYEEGRVSDYNCSVEVFTQGGFIEVESLGPLRTLKPGETAEHTERWSLHKDVKVGKTEAEVEAAIGKLTGMRRARPLRGAPLNKLAPGGGLQTSFFGRIFARQHPLPAGGSLFGVISTNSSSLMNSIACSRLNLRGGIRRMASSAVDARMFVCFFSLQMLTSMSLAREFSPTIMPS